MSTATIPQSRSKMQLLEHVRQKAGLSQTALSRVMNMTRSTYLAQLRSDAHDPRIIIVGKSLLFGLLDEQLPRPGLSTWEQIRITTRIVKQYAPLIAENMGS